MSAVDVMRELAFWAADTTCSMSETNERVSVRAAVAELIEALRLCRDELIGIDGHITDPDNPDGWTDGDLYAAYAKACAALVRCGGTK